MIPGASTPEPLRVRVDSRRFLIVDEALPVRRKLQEILYRTGVAAAEMRVAENAENAMELFVMEHPDVVFTELLGDASQEGIEMVLEMLRIDPQVRIVLVTAESLDAPIVRMAVRAGVFAVVPKPLRHEKVRQVMSEIESEEGGIERFR